MYKFNETDENWEVGFGLSPVTAAKVLARDFPEVAQWMAWNMKPDPAARSIRAMLGEESTTRVRLALGTGSGCLVLTAMSGSGLAGSNGHI